MKFVNSWLLCGPQTQPGIRLYCFPYAGGNASIYASWQALIGPHVTICPILLPGRGPRLAEPAESSLAHIVENIAEAIARQSGPFALFGHSMGALLAFEVSRYFSANKLPEPRHLFISGANAPRTRSTTQLHLLPDAELIEALRSYNGTPAEVLENEELLQYVLPLLRADFALGSTYKYQPGTPLNVPISILAGSEDPHCDLNQAKQWHKETCSTAETTWFQGDHFFLHSQCQSVIDYIRSVLKVADGSHGIDLELNAVGLALAPLAPMSDEIPRSHHNISQ